MRRILGLEQLTEPLVRSAVTVGKFFAIHRGHQALLHATVEAARARDAESVVLTFDRHPAEILRPGTTFPVITTLVERLELIEAQGIDTTILVCLTPEFLAQEPEEFVRRILVESLAAVEVLAGANFRFGKGARGDRGVLERMGAELGFRFTPVPPLLEDGERISSSRVAACIESGAVAEAAALLGRPYSVPGTVVRGDQVGRQLGFPTANIRTELERLLPADGVYVVHLRAGTESLGGVANLGVRPTRDGTRRVLEVHLPGWTGDLYGRAVCVEFLQRLRGEERFPSLDALKEQIGRDVRAASEYLAQGSGCLPANAVS